MADEDLAGALVKVRRGTELRPEHKAFPSEGPVADTVAFHVFPGGDLARPAKRVDRADHLAIERWVVRSEPGLGFQEARRAVGARLADVTIRDWLSLKMPYLSPEEVDATIRSGLFPVAKGGGSVAPGAPVVAGDLYLLSHREVVLIPGHLDFSYAENPFGAWGILSDVDQPTRRLIFLSLSVVAILAIAFLLVKPPTDAWVPLVALGGVLGGAIGNLVERIDPGYVVDFIHMYWGDMHWPRYNVADIGITVGVVVLVLATGFTKERKAPAPPKG
jgi:signal peptidase II